MKNRLINKTGDEISPMGFGAMRLPLKNGKVNRELAKKQIYHAIDRGINFIDTAYLYGDSESFLGEVLQGEYKDRVKICTKLPSINVRKYDDMERFLDEQLKRLQRDSIDYYLIHSVDLKTFNRLCKRDLIKFIEKAKRDGKIKHIGFSYHGPREEFETVLDGYDWDVVMVQYNYFDDNVQISAEGIEYAASKGMGIFVMEPLKGGLLAGELPPEVSALFDEVDSSKSSVDWALSWVFNQKEITCVLSGMGSLDQMKENMAIAERVEIDSLSDDELDVLDKAQGIFNSMMKINCTGCGYCLPCPKGVNIPDCFNVYNEKYLFNKKAFGVLPHAMVNYYMVVGGITNKQASAGLCNHCGRCKRLCPQSIDIPNELDRVKSEFELLGFNYQIKFVKNVAMPSINKISKVFDFFKHF